VKIYLAYQLKEKEDARGRPGPAAQQPQTEKRAPSAPCTHPRTRGPYHIIITARAPSRAAARIAAASAAGIRNLQDGLVQEAVDTPPRHRRMAATDLPPASPPSSAGSAPAAPTDKDQRARWYEAHKLMYRAFRSMLRRGHAALTNPKALAAMVTAVGGGAAVAAYVHFCTERGLAPLLADVTRLDRAGFDRLLAATVEYLKGTGGALRGAFRAMWNLHAFDGPAAAVEGPAAPEGSQPPHGAAQQEFFRVAPSHPQARQTQPRRLPRRFGPEDGPRAASSWRAVADLASNQILLDAGAATVRALTGLARGYARTAQFVWLVTAAGAAEVGEQWKKNKKNKQDNSKGGDDGWQPGRKAAPAAAAAGADDHFVQRTLAAAKRLAAKGATKVATGAGGAARSLTAHMTTPDGIAQLLFGAAVMLAVATLGSAAYYLFRSGAGAVSRARSWLHRRLFGGSRRRASRKKRRAAPNDTTLHA
jgi:hypothetical protein